MMLVDVHSHIDQFKNDEIDKIIDRAKKTGIKSIINNGIDIESNRKTLELSEKFSIVKAALGLHPEFIEKFDEETINNEIKFITRNRGRIIAIGEVGLDYYWIKEDKLKARQREMFSKFIELSLKIKKPIIVHSRKAEEDVIKLLEEYKTGMVVIHCFGGKLKLLEKILSNNWFLSIPPVIVRSTHFQGIVERTPLSSLLTETDAPFMSPFKDKKNEPAFVKETIKKISEIKSLTEEEVANNIFMNYQRIFS